MTQADPAVETFVRGTLGCGCPDEVFQQVEESALAAPEAPAAWRIAIGGRLLVYLWQPARGASIAAGVGEPELEFVAQVRRLPRVARALECRHQRAREAIG